MVNSKALLAGYVTVAAAAIAAITGSLSTASRLSATGTVDLGEGQTGAIAVSYDTASDELNLEVTGLGASGDTTLQISGGEIKIASSSGTKCEALSTQVDLTSILDAGSITLDNVSEGADADVGTGNFSESITCDARELETESPDAYYTPGDADVSVYRNLADEGIFEIEYTPEHVVKSADEEERRLRELHHNPGNLGNNAPAGLINWALGSATQNGSAHHLPNNVWAEAVANSNSLSVSQGTQSLPEEYTWTLEGIALCKPSQAADKGRKDWFCCRGEGYVLARYYANNQNAYGICVKGTENVYTAVLAFRGSETTDNWVGNFDTQIDPMCSHLGTINRRELGFGSFAANAGCYGVHHGFSTQYDNIKMNVRQVVNPYLDALQSTAYWETLARQGNGKILERVVAGHSSGSTFAKLATMDGVKYDILRTYADPRLFARQDGMVTYNVPFPDPNQLRHISWTNVRDPVAACPPHNQVIASGQKQKWQHVTSKLAAIYGKCDGSSNPSSYTPGAPAGFNGILDQCERSLTGNNIPERLPPSNNFWELVLFLVNGTGDYHGQAQIRKCFQFYYQTGLYPQTPLPSYNPTCDGKEYAKPGGYGPVEKIPAGLINSPKENNWYAMQRVPTRNSNPLYRFGKIDRE